MNIISGIIMAAMIVVGSYCLGLLVPEKKDDTSISVTMISGLMIAWAYFEIICEISIFMDFTYDFMNMLYFIPLGVACVLGILIRIKRIGSTIKTHFLGITPALFSILPVLIMIAFQTFMISRYMHVDWDDAYYVGTATTAVGTNSFFHFDPYTGTVMNVIQSRYVFSPFYFFYGAFSRLLGIPTAVAAHTIIPLILLPMTYMVYWAWSNEMFRDKLAYRSLFLSLVSVLMCWGAFSNYSSATFMLIRLWQGKAVVCSLAIPFLLLVLFKIWRDGMSAGNFILLFATSLSCCMLSSMGVVMSVIMIGIGWLMRMFHARKIFDSVSMLICIIPNVIIGVCYLLIG